MTNKEQLDYEIYLCEVFIWTISVIGTLGIAVLILIGAGVL